MLSTEVGGPRIDSTCFRLIPFETSSTPAFVRRFRSSRQVAKLAAARRVTQNNDFARLLHKMKIASGLRLAPQIRVLAVDLIILKVIIANRFPSS